MKDKDNRFLCLIVIIIVVIAIGIFIATRLVISINKEYRIENKDGSIKNITQYNEYVGEFNLKSLDNINFNTNDEFIFLDKNVNSELKDTFAFSMDYFYDNNQNEHYLIEAIKKDGTTKKIYSHKEEFCEVSSGVITYDNGKIYYNDDCNSLRSIDLNKGNNDYKENTYDFLTGYISEWFIINDNVIYYINTGNIYSCNLKTEECDMLVDISTDNINSSLYDDIYFDKENLLLYITSFKYGYDGYYDKNSEKLLKVDIKNKNVEEVLNIGKNAVNVYSGKKLEISTLMKFKNNHEIEQIEVTINNELYSISKQGYYINTILPNDYIMFEKDYKTLYLNLKTGIVDDYYEIGSNSNIYFIN